MSTDERDEEEAQAADARPGLRWLKYAGVGGGRDGGRLSGAAITSLGSLEAEVLGVVWDIGRPVTGMEVMEQSLYRRRERGEEPAAFATIATTLRRLTQKGLLTSDKGAQRTPVYTPTVEREEMAARILNNVSRTMLGSPLHALLPRLVGGGTQATPGKSAPNAPDFAVDDLLRALEELAAQEAGPAQAERRAGSPPGDGQGTGVAGDEPAA